MPDNLINKGIGCVSNEAYQNAGVSDILIKGTYTAKAFYEAAA